MLYSYFMSALRDAARNRMYSAINIAGLMVGLTCAVFILLFVKDALSYDKWIPGYRELARAEVSLFFPNAPPMPTVASPYQLAPTAQAEVPEVAGIGRLVREYTTIGYQDRTFSEHIAVVNPEFFEVVRLPFAAGDGTALHRPDSVVISQSYARKFFGETEPLGRVLTFGGSHSLVVRAVLADLPQNTQLAGDVFISDKSGADRLPQSEKDNWFAFNGFTYLKLVPGADRRRVEAKIQAMFARHIDPSILTGLKTSADRFIQVHLEPFGDVHVTTDANGGGMKPGSSWTVLSGLIVIGILILLAACFNFMNLATARATKRAREIGLRKVLGAMRGQLIVQFLCESVLLSLIAGVLALVLAGLLLPRFDELVGYAVPLDYVADWPTTLAVLLLAVLTGLIAGVYPAFVLSGARPVHALRPPAGVGGSGGLRAALVVAQFAISIALGISVIVIFSQVNFARHLDLGFDHDNIVVVGSAGQQFLNPSARDRFARGLESDPNILGTAQSSAVPFEANDTRSNATAPGRPGTIYVRTVDISPEFPRLYGMRLVAGRFLSRDRATDMSSSSDGAVASNRNVLIDEDAAKRFGLTPQSAVGAGLRIGDSAVTVVGVLHDALFHAAKEEGTPSVYFYNPDNITYLSVKIRGDHYADALAAIDRAWQSSVPGAPPRRRFLSDEFDKLYAADEKFGAIFSVFVSLAIFIAALGLFGVAAFTVQRRTREIGLRKVFGAQTWEVVVLLVWQFSRPVLLANLIAWPVAWYFLRDWLDGYAHRVSLSPVYFVMGGMAALFVAWATVIGHALAVARERPVRALRYE